VNARFCQIYAEAKRRFPPSFRHAPPVSSYDPRSLQHVCMWLISAASQSYPWCAAGESCRFRRCRRHLPAPSGRKHTGQTKITTLVVESMDFLRPCGQSVDLVLDNSIVLTAHVDIASLDRSGWDAADCGSSPSECRLWVTFRPIGGCIVTRLFGPVPICELTSCTLRSS
jgi:hypothetical protein